MRSITVTLLSLSQTDNSGRALNVFNIETLANIMSLKKDLETEVPIPRHIQRLSSRCLFIQRQEFRIRARENGLHGPKNPIGIILQ
jgi:hypothetical protein